MPKSTHKRRRASSQEGFIGDEYRKAMSKNEKIIMGVLVGGIMVFLLLSLLVLFTRTNDNGNTPSSTVPSARPTVAHSPYPTIPPIENMTVMMNARMFNPSEFSIPAGGFVDFFNITESPITIEAADGNSAILNLGAIGPSETKSVTFNVKGVYKFRNKDKPSQIGTITIK